MSATRDRANPTEASAKQGQPGSQPRRRSTHDARHVWSWQGSPFSATPPPNEAADRKGGLLEGVRGEGCVRGWEWSLVPSLCGGFAFPRRHKPLRAAAVNPRHSLTLKTSYSTTRTGRRCSAETKTVWLSRP